MITRISLNRTSIKGLRGVRFYDASDPAKILPLAEWSCDQGDPKREIQTGSGTHRNYYDGGQYAYLDTAPDNSFTRMESSVRYYSNGIQIIDVSDPTQPKFIANCWLPGQREGEEEAYKKWREYGDKSSFTTLHGPMYVPQKIEDGGKYGYSAYSAFGMMIHDLSDIKNPRLIGRYYPKMKPGAIPFHTIDIARLNRGFVITNPEALNPDCNEPYQPLWVVDIRDPTKPKSIAQLPVPVPPPDAPYRTFCDKRGRFGSHNPPHMKAPGTPDPNFTAYSFLMPAYSYSISGTRLSRATSVISFHRSQEASMIISAIRVTPTMSSSSGIANSCGLPPAPGFIS